MAQQLIICQILFSIRPRSPGSCTDGVIQKSVKVTKCLTCHYVSYQIGVERNVFQKKCWIWSPDVFTPCVARSQANKLKIIPWDSAWCAAAWCVVIGTICQIRSDMLPLISWHWSSQYCSAVEIQKHIYGVHFKSGGMFKPYGSEMVWKCAASLESGGSKALKPISPTWRVWLILHTSGVRCGSNRMICPVSHAFSLFDH